VLLTILPGHRGFRRYNRSGDPILCGDHGCYVSAGADAPADLMPLRRAFGIGRTLGERAGACRHSLGCVFRNVDLGTFPAILQPVDMRLLKHDRRQPQVLNEPSACRLTGGHLECTTIHGPDYTMWVVPEEVAAAAGPEALERAVEDGLDGPSPPVFVRN
jgi:colicin import membrane protein